MRHYMLVLIVSLPCILSAQPSDQDKGKKPQKMSRYGIKGGLNFANVTNASSINSSNNTGFNVGAYMGMSGQSLFGFRTELDFSRQGYNFKTNTNTGTVDLDYLLFSNFTTINFGKVAQLHVGALMAFMLNAKGDSTSAQGSGSYESMMQYYNRFDYGLSGGLEIYPLKGLIIGSRINVSFGNLYETPTTPTDQPPSFIPSVDAKNNVVQLYIGYKF